MKPTIILLALASLLSGCGTPSVYSWGQYEDMIYTSYAKPGSTPPEYQIERMEADLEKARAKNKPVHPGFHAHLGYLYAQIGKFDEAKRELETEKAQFPESAVFVDQLTTNLQRK